MLMTITRFACLLLLSLPCTGLAAQTNPVLPDAPDAAVAHSSITSANEYREVAISPVAPSETTTAEATALPNTAAEEFSSSATDWLDERNPTSSILEPGQTGDERYPYGKLVWESLAFTGAEDLYRLSTDQYMRHLIADGPYWHNYFASLKQWNMRRWNDGDDFLVDYVGHPMQGAVSGFIEIQNSPHDKYLRLSGSREYWHSRFHAMLWATVYSTQQKIGPLGEAALGSAGGYTYALHCPAPCKTYVPGVTKYTNNTGWTDFITTPVIGTLWTVFEDFLDKEVSDRVEDHLPGTIPAKIIRGSLNPTRTMANFMRGKNPWYRDYRHRPDMGAGVGSPNPTEPEEHFQGESSTGTGARFELFPHLDAISLPVNTPACKAGCRQMLYGPGIGFSSRLTHFVDFDSDVSMHSDASPLPSDRAGGSVTIGTFGFRSGIRTQRFALRASIRPGFLSYDKAYEFSPTKQNPTPPIGRITHFTTALALSSDLNLGRHTAARFVVLNLPVRYRESRTTHAGVGTPPYLNWLSKQIFATNENWGFQTGLVMRF
jgi:hypothetical protein